MNVVFAQDIMEMVPVEGGSFMMGNKYVYNEQDSRPLHQMRVNSFSMGKYEVTQAQWKKIMGYNPSYHKNCDDCPVDMVTYFEIQAFITKLNQKTGIIHRLPTETEWEYAAKGGNTGADFIYSGSNEWDSVAWFKVEGSNDSNDVSHPVGLKQPNTLGIYDMSGNVGEWCLDWYMFDFYVKGGKVNSGGPKTGKYRVVRGADFCTSENQAMVVSHRSSAKPETRSKHIGFRLVVDKAGFGTKKGNQ